MILNIDMYNDIYNMYICILYDYIANNCVRVCVCVRVGVNIIGPFRKYMQYTIVRHTLLAL